MNIINHYRTPNMLESLRRFKAKGTSRGLWKPNEFNVSRIKQFEHLPANIEILINYIDIIALRLNAIPTEIIYESIYRELPELFEE